MFEFLEMLSSSLGSVGDDMDFELGEADMEVDFRLSEILRSVS